ncbi:MAG: GNAT family N-acetyltransferase [Candidatus Omnitrophica bacterium]|nr:GNAT family N-acetyltransferase [Candidatus Omnitrophota bacterium]
MSISTVTIRPSNSSDAPQIVQLVTSILQKEFSKDQPAYPLEDLQQISTLYSPPNSTFLVAEEDHRIVGTCGVKSDSSKTAILRRLFVDSACRGKGVGSALLERALDFCRQKGYREVVIRTSTRMEGAIRLCCSLGFQEDGRWDLGEVTLVLFRLKLTS